MVNMKKVLLSIFSVFCTLYCFSLTCSSGGGTYASWAVTVWSCAPGPTVGPPGCSDNIIINGTIQMSADVNYSACPSPMNIVINGTLEFNTNGVRLLLPAGSSIVINAGGQIIKTFPGGGSSTLVSADGTNLWTAGDGNISGPLLLGVNPLPVELISFDAIKDPAGARLNWSTASETNNDYFTIQRTADGNKFEDIAKVGGAGNSSFVINYSAIDNTPLEGKSYYRLKQTDFNGHYSTSALIPFDFESSLAFSFDFYPNPKTIDDNINVLISEKENSEVLVVVYDVNGKESFSKVLITEINGKNVYAIDNSAQLSPGIYIITATSQQKVYSKRLIVQ
jgi:hypothetical protein